MRKSEKITRFESLESSAVGASLSNFVTGGLNVCAKLMQQLLPRRCVLCDAPTRVARICAGCDVELPRLPLARCGVCAVPLASGNVCGACLQAPPAFDRVSAVFAYAFPIDALIHAFKYGQQLSLAPVLGEALAASAAYDADVLVPMPLAPRRLSERGFNQALELARFVSRRHAIPVVATRCRKVIETPPQAALPWKERAKNVRHAFACDADFSGLRVAVVDDVLTTGATLNEFARVLRKAGAVSVAGWVVARTLPR
jgi:ComF family protein